VVTSLDWPKGFVCFPLFRAIDAIAANPKEAARLRVLLENEFTSSYQNIKAMVEALAGSTASSVPGPTLSKAERLVALKELVAAVGVRLERQGFSRAEIIEAYRLNAGDARMAGNRESQAAFLAQFLVRQRGEAPRVPGRADPARPTAAPTAVSSASFGPETRESPEPELDLEGLVDRVVSAVRGDVPGPVDDPQDCLVLLEGLAGALYPREWAGLPGGVRATGTVDDLVVRTGRAEQRLAPGAAWRRVPSWGELAGEVKAAQAGATGLVLLQRGSGKGHAFAVHYPGAGDVRWIDLQMPRGSRVMTRAPERGAAGARVVVVDGTGRVVSGPPTAESEDQARVVMDPPASRGYGAIGAEWEAPNIRLVFDVPEGAPEEEIPRTGDELFRTEHVRGVVEHVGEAFLEFVSMAIGVGPGDEGYVATNRGMTEAVQFILNLTRGGKKVPLSSLPAEFEVSAKAKYVSLYNASGETYLDTQITAGVESGGQYDLLRWALNPDNMPDSDTGTVDDIVTALSFAEDAAFRYAGWLGESHGAESPGIAGLLLHGGDVDSVRGYLASMFTHAIAPLRAEYARTHRVDHMPGIGPKQFLAVMSRHPVRTVRDDLPDTAKRYTDINEELLKSLFYQYAAKFGPNLKSRSKSTEQMLSTKIGFSDVVVGDYLDDALLEERATSPVAPGVYGVKTSFGRLDAGKAGGRAHPLNLNELRNIGGAERPAGASEQLSSVAADIRSILARTEGWRQRSNSLDRLGGPEAVAARLAGIPEVRDLEVLFQDAAYLNLHLRGADSRKRVDLDWGMFLDWVAHLVLHPGEDMDYVEHLKLVNALETHLNELEFLSKGALAYSAESGAMVFSVASLRWARAMGTATRLLARVDSPAEVPHEEGLTGWAENSEVRRSPGAKRFGGSYSRSPALQRIDASVAGLLADRQDPRRLLRVLSDIRWWRQTKKDASTAKRADAVEALEQRVMHEVTSLGLEHYSVLSAPGRQAPGGSRPRAVGVFRAEVPEVATVARQRLGERMVGALATGDPDELARASHLIDRLEPVTEPRVGRGVPSVEGVPLSLRLHVTPVLADFAADLDELVLDAGLAEELWELSDDFLNAVPGASSQVSKDLAEGLRVAGGLLAELVRERVLAEGPLGRVQLTLRAKADSDVVPALLGSGLVQVVSNVLSKRVVLNYGVNIPAVTICPEGV
jgi:hypothetical protein